MNFDFRPLESTGEGADDEIVDLGAGVGGATEGTVEVGRDGCEGAGGAT